MVVSPLVPFLEAFKAQLEARFAGDTDLAKVRTFYVPPSQDVSQRDAVILWRGYRARELQQYAMASTRDRNDELAIPGQIESFAAAPAADDAFIAAAVRCSAILDAVGDELVNHTPDLMPDFQIRSPLVSGIDWLPMIVDTGGWIVRGNFTITLKARAR